MRCDAAQALRKDVASAGVATSLAAPTSRVRFDGPRRAPGGARSLHRCERGGRPPREERAVDRCTDTPHQVRRTSASPSTALQHSILPVRRQRAASRPRQNLGRPLLDQRAPSNWPPSKLLCPSFSLAERRQPESPACAHPAVPFICWAAWSPLVYSGLLWSSPPTFAIANSARPPY
jgi:hypothetical protein